MLLQNKKRLVVIVGPTAVGKTEIAIELAEALNGEIISADSRYFYLGMDIGTAKPDIVQLARVRHHLINVAKINDNWSLANFQQAANAAIGEIISKGKLPFLVGGTGQFIRAIIEGWQIPAKAEDLRIRRAVEKWIDITGAEEAHKKLSIIDSTAAELIDFRNKRRTIRALEVIFHTGRKFSEQRTKGYVDFEYKIIGLHRDRKELFDRIDNRIVDMFKNGLIKEVEELLSAGYSIKDPPMSAIGYQEVIQYIQGSIDFQICQDQIKKRSHEYVRRQANWFKKSDERITWFDVTVNQKENMIAYIKSEKGWLNA